MLPYRALSKILFKKNTKFLLDNTKKHLQFTNKNAFLYTIKYIQKNKN